MKKNITSYLALLIALLALMPEAVATQAVGEAKPEVAIALSGGISLGSYEAGLNWAMIKYLKNEAGEEMPRLKAVSGASAGSINALISAVVSCLKPDSSFTINDGDKKRIVKNSADKNWFREIWLPIGFDELLPDNVSNYDLEDGLLSRHAFNQLINNLDNQIKDKQAFIAKCEVPITMMLTREQARVIELNPESASTIRVKNARFSMRIIFRVDAKGEAGFYSRPPEKKRPITQGETIAKGYEGNVIYLPGIPVAGENGPEYKLLFFENYAGKSLKQRKYNRVADVVLASSAFPIAFGKKSVAYCEESSIELKGEAIQQAGQYVCPAAMQAKISSFVDGGVFDNVPLGVLEEEMRGLKKKQYIFLDPDYRRPHHAEQSESQKSEAKNSDFGLLSQFGFLGDTVTTARQYELYNLINYHAAEFNNNIRIPNRFFPLSASYFGNFGAFWGRELREFDYAVGVYDAIYFLASLECNGDKACMPSTFKDIYKGEGKNSLKINDFPSIDIVVKNIATKEFKNSDRWVGEINTQISSDEKPLIKNQYRIFSALNYKQLGPYDHLNMEEPKPVPYGKAKDFKSFIKALRAACVNLDEESAQSCEEIDFEPTEGAMLERIIGLSDWDQDAWLYPITSRLTTRQLALEKSAVKKFKLSKAIALGVNTKYRDVKRPFTRSTAPRGAWEAWVMPYEIGADVANGGLIAAWEARIPFHIIGESAVSIKLTPLIWNRNQSGISRTGQLDLIGSYAVDTLAVSSIGIGPSFNMNYNKNLGSFKKYSVGAMGYIGMFADKFRISFGMRSFKRNHYVGDRAYISIGITDVPGIFYWLSQ